MISAWHKIDVKIGRPKGSFKLSEIHGTKKCCSCKLTKLTHHFPKDRSRNDGLDVRCKECQTNRMNYLNRLKGKLKRPLVLSERWDF